MCVYAYIMIMCTRSQPSVRARSLAINFPLNNFEYEKCVSVCCKQSARLQVLYYTTEYSYT